MISGTDYYKYRAVTRHEIFALICTVRFATEKQKVIGKINHESIMLPYCGATKKHSVRVALSFDLSN